MVSRLRRLEPRPPTSPHSSSRCGRTFDRNYSYFDHKRIDWNALKAEFAPRVAGLTQNEFVLLVQNMLGRLHDPHLVLTSGNTTLRTYTPDYFVNWDNSVWQQYLARGGAQVRNGAVSAVFDGVPYIAVQSWNPTRVNVSDLDAFLDAFRDRPALTLDVRMNPGGNDQPAFDFAGRFTTSTTTSGFVQFRNGPGHSDFTSRQARTFSPHPPAERPAGRTEPRRRLSRRRSDPCMNVEERRHTTSIGASPSKPPWLPLCSRSATRCAPSGANPCMPAPSLRRSR